MIAVVAIVVLGPERLPSTMRSVAKFLQQVRAIYDELTSQFSEELKPLQDLNPQKLLQEFTDQLTVEEATKAQPVATQPTPVTPNPATPATTPVKSVSQPTVVASATPSVTLSNNDASAPAIQIVSAQETQVAPVAENVIER